MVLVIFPFLTHFIIDKSIMLEFDEVAVFFTRFHEFTMIPIRNNFSSFEHIDTIDMLDGRESMGDDDTRATFHKFLK
jgi:hypothetical protein